LPFIGYVPLGIGNCDSNYNSIPLHDDKMMGVPLHFALAASGAEDLCVSVSVYLCISGIYAAAVSLTCCLLRLGGVLCCVTVCVCVCVSVCLCVCVCFITLRLFLK
jgi:hypothetical protein